MMRSSKKKSAMQSRGTAATMKTEVFRSNKRKKAAVPGCAASLPEEMITEVLLRLPVKSILRFRAVCTALLQGFLQPPHGDRQGAPAPAPPNLLVVSPTARLDSTAVYSCSPSRPRDDLLFTLDHARRNSVDVVTPSPCCGLTLLYDAVAPAYYVCNAATRAVTRLPPFRDARRDSTAGLGFDARTREYKVVRFINGYAFEKEMITCEVTMGIAGGRRPAAGGIPFRWFQFATVAVINAVMNKIPPVFANGFLHWLINPSCHATDIALC